jgi:hypothetical protein
MNSRERFRATMAGDPVDRPPLFEEGIRAAVLEAWRQEGLPADATPGDLFTFDRREELALDLEPRGLAAWPTRPADLPAFRCSLDPDDPTRLPKDWSKRVRAWRERDHALMLRVHQGLFLSLGIDGWDSFAVAMRLLARQPTLAHALMRQQGELAAALADRFLVEVDVDAALFSEPIAGNTGPLISPQMYETFALDHYEPVLAVLRRHGVETIIMRTYANARALVPAILARGFNCLWACEVGSDAMDYLALRRTYGTELRLIAGIDADALRRGPAAIRHEILRQVPALLDQGRYAPLADGRVREVVPYANYVCYRRLLGQLI